MGDGGGTRTRGDEPPGAGGQEAGVGGEDYPRRATAAIRSPAKVATRIPTKSRARRRGNPPDTPRPRASCPESVKMSCIMWEGTPPADVPKVSPTYQGLPGVPTRPPTHPHPPHPKTQGPPTGTLGPGCGSPPQNARTTDRDAGTWEREQGTRFCSKTVEPFYILHVNLL